MSRRWLSLLCGGAVAVCALFSARAQEETSAHTLRLLDAGKQPRAGIVRLWTQEGKLVRPAGALPRLLGVKVAEEHDGWCVVPAKGLPIALPRAVYRCEALAGLETMKTETVIDLRRDAAEAINLPLPSCFDPERHGLVAGNTHLHLMKISKEQAEDYLKQVPAADGLRVLFISYLERFKDDAEYITNRYPIGPLPELSKTGVLFNNGEEHRHNFGSHGEGYGHVMFLGIKDIVKPVSLGPGITGAGFDDRPLRPGIDDAKRQGGTIIWCHNAFGREDVPSAITGRLDALNVFDGSRKGDFAETYYRFLNVGLKLPISTGTDWFLYDFARVYAKVDGPLTIASWLGALKAGRNVITNGPLLTLTIDGKQAGDVIALDGARSVKIEATAIGRHDPKELQLVYNGKVIQRAQSTHAAGQPYRAELRRELRLEGPGWLAARIESSAKNELGHELFAHTSPIYVTWKGRRHFDADAAQALLKQMEEGQAAIEQQGKFTAPEARAKLLALYQEAAIELTRRINER
jgi:hypothetical protein